MWDQQRPCIFLHLRQEHRTLIQGEWCKIVPSNSVQRTHCLRFPIGFPLRASHGDRGDTLKNANTERRPHRNKGPALAEREKSRKNRIGRPNCSGIMSQLPICSLC